MEINIDNFKKDKSVINVDCFTKGDVIQFTRKSEYDDNTFVSYGIVTYVEEEYLKLIMASRLYSKGYDEKKITLKDLENYDSIEILNKTKALPLEPAIETIEISISFVDEESQPLVMDKIVIMDSLDNEIIELENVDKYEGLIIKENLYKVIAQKEGYITSETILTLEELVEPITILITKETEEIPLPENPDGTDNPEPTE